MSVEHAPTTIQPGDHLADAASIAGFNKYLFLGLGAVQGAIDVIGITADIVQHKSIQGDLFSLGETSAIAGIAYVGLSYMQQKYQQRAEQARIQR